MATPEKALYALLSGADPVAAIVGTRIFPIVTPEPDSPVGADLSTLPAVSYFRVSAPRVHLNDGSSFARIRMQVDCWANSYEAARCLADAVRVAIHGFKGIVADFAIDSILIEDETELYEKDTKIRHVAQDYRISYGE